MRRERERENKERQASFLLVGGLVHVVHVSKKEARQGMSLFNYQLERESSCARCECERERVGGSRGESE